MPAKEREAYEEYEKGLQKDYVKVRYRLRNHNGSHTMEVLTLLSKFRQVGVQHCGCRCGRCCCVCVCMCFFFFCGVFFFWRAFASVFVFLLCCGSLLLGWRR